MFLCRRKRFAILEKKQGLIWKKNLFENQELSIKGLAMKKAWNN